MTRARSIADIGDDVAGGGSLVTTSSPSLGRRNLIINGAVQIDQRNGGSSVTTATNYVYACDRWQVGYGSGGAITGQQSTTAPSGFTNSVGLSVNTTDDLSLAADFYGVRTKIEGSSVAHLKWGTADAETITLSFWVRSSVTGTYVAGITNGAGNRSYPATYTVSSANTWEYKTITISGDTSGTWNTGNNVGLDLFFYLGAGTDYATGTANAWNASGYLQTSSQVGWISNTGATFYLTGVQLEVGSVATPFEHRSYGEEMELCRRYYFRLINAANEVYGQGFNYGVYVRTAIHPQTTAFRALPSIEYVGPTTFFRKGTNATNNVNTTGNPWEIVASNKNTIFMQSQISDTGEDGVSGSLYLTGTGCHVSFNAEL